MYTAVLYGHSWLRWGVVLFGFAAVIAAFAGILGRRGWSPLDDKLGLIFVGLLDLQALLGLLLYFGLSPYTKTAMHDFGAAMSNGGLRYWAVEHVFGMLVGLVLAHRGRTRVRAMSDPLSKHRVAGVFFTLALIAILVSIPWPGTPNGRPLFRF